MANGHELGMDRGEEVYDGEEAPRIMYDSEGRVLRPLREVIAEYQVMLEQQTSPPVTPPATEV